MRTSSPRADRTHPPRLAGWGAALLAGALLFAGACGGGGDRSPFDFAGSDYPGIVVLPLAAYLANRPTAPDDERDPETGIVGVVRQAADTDRDRPFMADWDTMLGLASNGMGDMRDAMRYYLAYEVTSEPSSGVCTVVVHVYEGLPFDPTRPETTSFSASVGLGEMHRAGFEITTHDECENEAGYRVAEAMEAAGFFPEGWSVGPPGHAGG